MSRLGLSFALACALSVPAVARADAAAEARAHFEAARAAYRQADYTTAITEFEAAYAAKPSGVIRYNIAQCFEKLGDIPGALLNYQRYLRETPHAEDRAVVEKAIANLERRLQARGVQQLTVFTRPTGAAVTVDGKAHGQAPVSVELSPGAHQVDLVLPGYETTRREVTVAADKSLELDVALSPGTSTPAPGALAPQQSSTPPAQQEVQTPAHRTPALRIASYATAGAGVALLGLGLLENAQVSGDNGEIQSRQGSVQGNYDDAKTAATVRDVAYVASGAALAAGVAMFLLSPSDAPATRAAIAPIPGGMTAVVTRQF